MDLNMIGEALNCGVKAAVKLYEDGKLSKEDTFWLLDQIADGISYFDSDEDSDLWKGVYNKYCGRCFRQIDKNTESVYSLSRGVSENLRKAGHGETLLYDWLCPDCFDKLVNAYKNDDTFGAKERELMDSIGNK